MCFFFFIRERIVCYHIGFFVIIYASAINFVVSRTMLLEGVWDYHFDPNTNVVDVHISKLRRQLDEDGADPIIETVRGAGYMVSDG